MIYLCKHRTFPAHHRSTPRGLRSQLRLPEPEATPAAPAPTRATPTVVPTEAPAKAEELRGGGHFCHSYSYGLVGGFKHEFDLPSYIYMDIYIYIYIYIYGMSSFPLTKSIIFQDDFF